MEPCLKMLYYLIKKILRKLRSICILEQQFGQTTFIESQKESPFISGINLLSC
jgi:hypothetical protein